MASAVRSPIVPSVRLPVSAVEASHWTDAFFPELAKDPQRGGTYGIACAFAEVDQHLAKNSGSPAALSAAWSRSPTLRSDRNHKSVGTSDQSEP